jgi:hypothetical protein
VREAEDVHQDYEIDRGKLEAIIARVRTLGVTVTEDLNEPEGARFIGTFTGRHLTLFPKFDSNFALYFTVGHLYGHMCQIAISTLDVAPGVDIGIETGRPLTPEEIQSVYDYEFEAARIGQRLICELGHQEQQLDREYARMFFADFHYLINFMETGEQGPAAFARFLRREPLPWAPITPDERPLTDLNGKTLSGPDVVVV